MFDGKFMEVVSKEGVVAIVSCLRTLLGVVINDL